MIEREMSFMGRIPGREAAESMTELVRDGLVDAFEFDRTTGRYVRTTVNNVPVEKKALEETWFLITSKGRSELDASWVDS